MSDKISAVNQVAAVAKGNTVGFVFHFFSKQNIVGIVFHFYSKENMA